MIDLFVRLIDRRIGIVGSLLVRGLAIQFPVTAQDRSSSPSRGDNEFPEFELPSLSGDTPSDRGRPDARKRPGGGGGGSRLNEPLPLDPVSPGAPDDERFPLLRESTFDDPLPLRSSDSERNALPAADVVQTDDGSFDWNQQPLSIADIEIGRVWPFEHGKLNLNDAEADAYVTLLRAVLARKFQATSQLPDSVNVTSAWETAFYRFEDVRRQAWQNGMVRLQRRSNEPADPFAIGNSTVLSATDRVFDPEELKAYSMLVDMQVHPAEFVGRPIIMYGLFTPLAPLELQAKETLDGEPSQFRMQRGSLRNLTNTETIAIIDAMSYVDAVSQSKPSTAWPVDKRVLMPVLIKGWFVKLWGQRPLLFTEVARVLTPRPYDEFIREQVRSKRRVSEDESWLYYETLRQLQVTNNAVQAGIALKEQGNRVTELLQEIHKKGDDESEVLAREVRNGTIPRVDEGNTEGYETRRTRLSRQLEVRSRRHLEYQHHPDTYPVYVDVVQNPDRWHGRLVTLRGHVRQVTTHAGDSTFFDGQPLHELWLFTDDSQNNPAVIVTPSLPKDFPVSADIIDDVTVTACFFKMYSYRSQTENGLAPLLLAGHVSWTPTSDQVLTLAKDGHIPSRSTLVATARAVDSRSLSDTMVLLLGFAALLAAMTVWGRVQRDRRERTRLMLLVDERPDFRHTSQSLFSEPIATPGYEPIRG